MQTIELDGFEVSLYRDDVGNLRLEIDSSEMEDFEGQCPKFELTINHELDYRPNPSGNGWQTFLGGVGWVDC